MMILGIRFYEVKDAALVSDVGGDQRVDSLNYFGYVSGTKH